MNLLAATFAYSALAALALAMRRHYRTVFNREANAKARLTWRLVGWALIIISLLVELQADGPGLGIVAWIIGLAVAGFALTFILTYKPRWWFVPAGGLFLAFVTRGLLG